MKYLIEYKLFEFTDRELQAYQNWAAGILSKEPDSSKELMRRRLEVLKDNFFRVKNRLANKDVFQYKTYFDLKDVVDDEEQNILHKDVNKRIKMAEFNKDWIDLEVNDPNWTVLIPLTHVGSCKISQGTKWCTAMKFSEERYSEYKKRGELFRFINKNLNEDNYWKKVSLNWKFEGKRIWNSREDYELKEVKTEEGIQLIDYVPSHGQSPDLILTSTFDKIEEYYLQQKKQRWFSSTVIQ
jgi:hypothetical protein